MKCVLMCVWCCSGSRAAGRVGTAATATGVGAAVDVGAVGGVIVAFALVLLVAGVKRVGAMDAIAPLSVYFLYLYISLTLSISIPVPVPVLLSVPVRFSVQLCCV